MGGEEAMTEVDDEDAESYQEMLRLSAEGNELYEAGKLEEAAQTYNAAYQAYPQAILLKNEMITRYLIEECETAIELGGQFLETGDGSAEDRDDVEAVLAECSLDLAEAALADDELDETARWLDHGEPYFAEADLAEDAREVRAGLDEKIADDDEEMAVEPPPEDSGMDMKTIGGLSLTGVGAVTLGSALVWHLRWESRHSDLEELRNQADDDPSMVSDFESEQADAQDSYDRVRWAVPTLYGVGFAATAAGIALLVLPSSDDGGESSAMIHPVVSGDGAGAAFTLSF